MKDIKYFFKRKIWQIKNVFKWLPVIWNQYDFDYKYSIDAFKFQLQKQAQLMESDKSNLLNAKLYASKIRTALRLMDKVYNDEYAIEYQEKIKEKWGEDVLEWIFEDTGKGDNSRYLKYKYESFDNKDEIKKDFDVLFKESQEKQKRAHKLLWSFIEHNIQTWWD